LCTSIITPKDLTEITPLLPAALYNQTAIVRLPLQGGTVKFRTCTLAETTVQACGACEGNLAIVKMLMEDFGADVGHDKESKIAVAVVYFKPMCTKQKDTNDLLSQRLYENCDVIVTSRPWCVEKLKSTVLNKVIDIRPISTNCACK